jgi:hypothetical protein
MVQATADATYLNTELLFDRVRPLEILPTHRILFRDLGSFNLGSPFSRVGYTCNAHSKPIA